jgi:hypothetical protein
MMKEGLFLRALFSWDEFWATIRLGWSLVGDPRSLSDKDLEAWVVEPASTDPEFLEFWEIYDRHNKNLFLSFSLWAQLVYFRVTKVEDGRSFSSSDSDPTKLAAVYYLASRSMEWLGLGGGARYWVYAFFGGRVNPDFPWFQPHEQKRRMLKSPPSLRDFGAIVKAVNLKGSRLTESEIKSLLFGSFKRRSKSKYPKLDPGFMKSKKGNAHPLYSLIHLAKFKGKMPWVGISKVIDKKVEACFDGKLDIEDLLKEEITGNPDLLEKLETILIEKGEAKFRRQFGEEATRVYRAIHGRFRRRHCKMPTPPTGWRKRCLQDVYHYLVSRQKSLGIILARPL